MDQKHDDVQCKAIGINFIIKIEKCGILIYFLFIVSKPAPFWKATAVVNGHVTELKLSDYNGRYLVLFFYPQDL